MKRMHVGLGSICIQTKHEIVHAMYVRLVDGGMPYEEEDTCMYVRLTPGREPEEQEQGQGQGSLLLLLLRCARERATTQARP